MDSPDIKGLDALISGCKRLDGTQVQSGFFDSKYGADNDNLYVAQVAWFNENGTYHNPRRPFLLPAYEDWMNRTHFARYSERIFTDIINGRAYDQRLKQLGQDFADIIATNIDDYPGSNSKWWAEFKGFNDPLLYTGKMLDSVTFRIKKR